MSSFMQARKAAADAGEKSFEYTTKDGKTRKYELVEGKKGAKIYKCVENCAEKKKRSPRKKSSRKKSPRRRSSKKGNECGPYQYRKKITDKNGRVSYRCVNRKRMAPKNREGLAAFGLGGGASEWQKKLKEAHAGKKSSFRYRGRLYTRQKSGMYKCDDSEFEESGIGLKCDVRKRSAKKKSKKKKSAAKKKSKKGNECGPYQYRKKITDKNGRVSYRCVNRKRMAPKNREGLAAFGLGGGGQCDDE